MLVVPQTEVRLINNVPLNKSYEHQMTFNDKTAQANYFINKSAHTFQDFTYVKEDGSIKVPKGRDSLYACNYVMFKNTDFTGKWFYGFITKLEYVNPDTTKVHFELDVFQTWQFDFTFNPSFVEREHAKRWNSDGTPVVNTIDEGLDYGTAYETVDVVNIKPNDGFKFLVMISKESIHESDRKVKPSVIGAPQPLTYYVTPFKDDKGMVAILPDGVDVPISPPSHALEKIYESENATNNIVAIYLTEHIGIQTEVNGSTMSFKNVGVNNIDQAVFDGVYTLVVKNVTSFIPDVIPVGDKYDGFREVSESKLLMYPYTVTVLDDFKGNRIEIKNEYVNDRELQLIVKGSLGLMNKVSYGVWQYNYDGTQVDRPFQVSNENALINNNPNDIPVVTDLLSAYLQGNRNSLEAQRNAIMFNGTVGGAGVLAGAVGGGMVGGIPGAVVGAGLGLASSLGGTYHQVKAMESKIEDIDNQPSQLSKQGGNTAYDYGNGYEGVWVIKKQIKPEYQKKLTDYFKMFGYKINELKVPNLKSRTHFNFIRTVGANLTGNVPQEDLLLIKNIFDNGVTLWHTSDVGNYSLANGER